jgi:hypothetical protein
MSTFVQLLALTMLWPLVGIPIAAAITSRTKEETEEGRIPVIASGLLWPVALVCLFMAMLLFVLDRLITWWERYLSPHMPRGFYAWLEEKLGPLPPRYPRGAAPALPPHQAR